MLPLNVGCGAGDHAALEVAMPVEVIGMIGTQDESRRTGSMVHVSTASGVSPEFTAAFARAHEQAGFDQVLIGYRSTTADGFQVAGYAAGSTTRLRYLIAHRPGFMQPTLAARAAATLDRFTGGRVALHIITGGSDADQQRDGDYADHDTRYRRSGEYMDVLRRIWTSEEPFDYEGDFYRFTSAFSQVKPLQQPHVPLYFGGASAPAIEVGAQYADVYALWGEPLEGVRERISQIRTVAASHGRKPQFHVSLRPIIAPTEDEAWERARQILERVEAARPPSMVLAEASNEGSRRLLDFAARSDVHDERLWMPLASATGAAGNTTALVGTPEQVADALAAYYDLGVEKILIRGFDPLPDAVEFGRELIPALRDRVAARDAANNQ
jgi:alkanesulfonate monooxygenase